jgi:hypothetical protein
LRACDNGREQIVSLAYSPGVPFTRASRDRFMTGSPHLLVV